MSSTKLALHAATVVAALTIFACLWTMLGRLGADVELEWMTGAIHDAVDRVRAGKELYVAPSVDWTPFLYPPLYVWLVAKLSALLPFSLAARGLSILATLASAGCVWRLARAHGASRAWSFVGIGVFAAAFGNVSYWYDVERVDSLLVALLMGATVLLVEREGLLATAGAAMLVGLAFFAKQPALVFALAATGALAVRRSFARAAVFALVSGAIIGGGILWLQARSDGWFAYYVFRVPSAHGIRPKLFTVLFFEDVPRAFALVAAMAWLTVRFVRHRRDGILTAMCLAAAFASGSSRVHLGGWDNVLVFFTTFGSVAVAIAGTELGARALVPAVVAVQMALWSWSPRAQMPDATAVSAARAFEAKVKELEKDGEVLVLGRGHVTTPPHAHLAALNDVYQAEHRIPDRIAASFREARFAAIVLDGLDDLDLPYIPVLHGDLATIVLARYAIAERLPEMPGAIVGYHTRPRLVLRPRATPLDEHAPTTVRCHADEELAAVEGNHADLARCAELLR